MASWCLLPQFVEDFKSKLRDGTIDPIKLHDMGSEGRHEFFSKLYGEENATNINSLFESKLLLQNQKAGYISWAKKVAGISVSTRRDLIARIERMDKVLNPEEEGAFLQDLASTKLGTDVSHIEAKNIFDLSKKVQEAKLNSGDSLAGVSDEYLKARNDLNSYVASLKPVSAAMSIGRNLNTIGRNNLLLNPATPIKTAIGTIGNSAMDFVTRRVATLSARGANPELVRGAMKESWKTFRATGDNIASMESMDDTHALNKGENFKPQGGTAQGNKVVQALATGVGAVAKVSNKVAIDIEHNTPFTKFYQQNFYDMSNIVSSEMAKQEGLKGAELKSRAAMIFKDAARIEPETKEGQVVRSVSQRQAARATSTNDTAVARLTLGIKNSLNKVFPGFPIGDIISPIAKIPANIVSNGLENSGIGAPKAIFDIVKGREKIQSSDLATKYEGMGQFRSGMQSLLRIGGTLGVAAYITSQLSPKDFKTDKFGVSHVNIGGTWINTEYIAAISPALAGMMMVKAKGQPGQGIQETGSQYLGGAATGLSNLPGASEISNLISSVTNGSWDKGVGKYLTSFITSRSRPAFVKSLQSGNPLNSALFGSSGVESSAQMAQSKSKGINWSQQPTKQQSAFLNRVGPQQFKQANDTFNKQYGDWLNKTAQTPEYKNMATTEQQSLETAKKSSLEKQIFKQYGFTYKPTAQDKQASAQRKTLIKSP